MSQEKEVAIFGGGCFWCTEAVFNQIRGVISVTSGYAGGIKKNPTYEEVSAGNTGHAEVVRIEFNPEKISYDDLLAVFFATHNPTTPNRQGLDTGTQYRSIVFYTNETQHQKVESFIRNLNDSGLKIITEVSPLEKFYEAESYHQKYYDQNNDAPYCQIVIDPKLEKVKQRFNELLKSS